MVDRVLGTTALSAAVLMCTLCVESRALAQVIAPGTTGSPVDLQQDVLKAYLSSNEPFFLDDANTVMHLKGSDFDGAVLRAGKTLVSHRSLGPFSATSYFGGGTWAAALVATGHMGCVVFQPTTAGAGLLVQNSDLATLGYRLKVNAGQTVSLDVFTTAGATTFTTANTAAINQQHIVCHGYDPSVSEGYIQLDGGAVAGGAVAGIPDTYTGDTYIGYDGIGFTAAFTGTIAEIWTRSAPWNTALAASIAAAAVATTVQSPILPGLAGYNGLAAQSTTVAHCVGDDYMGSGWNCNPSRVKHTSVGTFSDTPLAPADYLYYGATLPLPDAGWSECVVFNPSATAGTYALFSRYNVAGGMNAWVDGSTRTAYCTYDDAIGLVDNLAATGTVQVSRTNLLCCGLDAAGNGYAMLNDNAVATAAVGYAYPAGVVTYLGRANNAGGPTPGMIGEVWVGGAWVTADMTAYRTTAMAAVTGPALAPFAADSGTVLYTVFDDYTGTGIASRTNTGGSEWVVGAGGILRSDRKRYNWPATYTALSGFVASTDAPFNWPAVAWTMVGAVPAARSSAGFPTGFGPERRQLGGFTDANYVGFATARDVMDLAQFTACISWYQGSLAATEVIYSNGVANNGGIYAFHVGGSATLSIVYNGGGVAPASPVTITANADNVVCFGRDVANNAYAVANASVVVGPTATAAFVAGTVYNAFLGRYNNAGSPAVNSRLKEFWFSSTPVTSAYLTQQALATLRCNTPGPCIPEDPNTVMHCTVDTDWNGGLRCSKNIGNQGWATVGAPTLSSAQTAWAYGTTGVDREGVGSFTDANYFTGTVGGPLQFSAAGWEVCAVFKHDAAPTTNPVLLMDGAAATDGWWMQVLNAGTFRCTVQSGGGGGTADTANLAVVNGLNVGCCAYDGANVKAKLNGGATVSAARAYVAPAARTPLIGRYSAAGSSYAGKIYEVWASNTPFTEADIAARQARFMNLFAGSYGELETFTRATTSSTTDPDGNISYVPAGMTVNEKPGLLVYLDYINQSPYSEQFDQNPPWVPTNLAATPNTVAAPDGQVTAETMTDNANNTAHEVVEAYVATARSWSLSVYARAGTLGFVHLSPDNTNFTWFNLATCTVGTNAAGNTAYSYASIPGWCRVAVSRTMVAGAANASIGVSVADATRVYVGAGGTVYLWGGQLGAGAYGYFSHVAPYIPTTNIAVQRNGDAVSMVNPLTSNTDFCVEGYFTPFGGRTWEANNEMWAIGSPAATANTAQAAAGNAGGGNIRFDVYDAGNVLKRATWAHGFAIGSAHKIKWCDLGGTLSLYADDVRRTPTISGLGTGIISTMPSTVLVGRAGAGFEYWDGWIKDFVIDPPLLPSSEVTLRQPFNFSDPVDLTQAGVVAPSLDCRGSQYVGGATWPCTGGAGNRVGAATSGNRTPYGPSGFATATTPETSPFFNSGTPDYFDFGDVLDPTGDFSGFAVFRTNTTAAGNAALLVKDDVGANRQYAFFRNGTAIILSVCKAGGVCSTLTLGNVVANEWNICAFSYDFISDGGSVIRGNCNGVAPAENVTAVGPPVDLAAPLRVGYANAGFPGWSGYIARERFWQTRAFTAAQLAQLVSLLQTGVASPVTNTRTGVATYMPHGPSATIPSLFNASARTPRVEQNGVLAEGARTNYAWPSGDLNNARWVKSAGIALTLDGWTFVDGNVTMDQINSTLNTDTATQTVASASSTTFSASAWARSNAGSTVESIIGSCPAANAVTACTCGTNTGLACTAAINPGATNECYAYATFTTAPVRIWVNFTCTAATTTPSIGYHDGQYLVSAGIKGIYDGGQLEVGLYPTSYIPTSTGTVPRVVDLNQQTNKLLDPQTRWCVKATATPENSSAWLGSPSRVMIQGGALAAANTFGLQANSTNIIGVVYDATAASRSITWAHGYAAGSTHTLYFCSNNGVLTLWSDGANTGAAPAGAGTGIVTTQPSPLYVGSAAGGTYAFDGNLAYVDQCPNADPTRCW